MRTAGQILQAVRVQKKQDLADVARITRIRTPYLQAIETDNYRQLPSGTVARGFIRNYSEFLGLNSEHILAIFRRDFVENQQGQIVPRGMAEPVTRVSFWTPKTTLVTTLTAVITIFVLYMMYQYRILTGPPYLLVRQPTNQLVVSEDTVQVGGETDPEATLVINNQMVVLDKGGRFTIRLPLTPGSNQIKVEASSKSGKITTVTREVTYTP